MKTQPITKNAVTIEGRSLRQALAPILRIIEKRNTYPILGSVRLQLVGPTMIITGTDLDIEISTKVDLNESEGAFDMCVYPSTLAGIARVAGAALVRIERVERLADGTRGLTLDPEARVTIGDDTSYTLPILSAEGWPSMAGERGELIERFTNGSLASMLAKVAPYISSEETRYYLNGVCWQDGERGRRFVATDGHRLGACRYMADKGQPASRIIPRKTVALLMAVAAGQDVSIYSVTGKEHSQIELTAGRTTIRTKLIEGTFPDVDRVIPALDGAGHRLTLNRIDILAAIDRVMVMAGSNRAGAAIRFFPVDGTLSLDRKNHDMGAATARASTAMPDDCPEFGLNATYIRGMIAGCQGDAVLHFKDAGSPFRLTDEDETMTRVLMPMRV